MIVPGCQNTNPYLLGLNFCQTRTGPFLGVRVSLAATALKWDCVLTFLIFSYRSQTSRHVVSGILAALLPGVLLVHLGAPRTCCQGPA